MNIAPGPLPYVSEQFAQPFREEVPAPLLLDPGAAPLAHAGAEFGVEEEGGDAVGGLLGGLAADDPAGLAVEDGVGGAAGVAA